MGKRWRRRLKNVYHWLRSWFWVGYFRYPAGGVRVVGVTGTDGKTTTCNLIYEILKAAGYKVGLVSTVGIKYMGEKEMGLEMGLHVTNPDARVLQGLLRWMADAGCTDVVLEVTSHGLDQNRVVGCNFAVGVLTNISHEHLDYHGSMERYVVTKSKLFRGVKYAVLNRDDEWWEYFASRVGRGEVVEYTKSETAKISPALAGEYNRHNVGAAEAVGRVLGVDREVVEKVVREFGGVAGRREEITRGQKYRCIVDFAHTPKALEELLKSLRREMKAKSKLILVFGCTGERDKAKRPVMGEVAARLADVVIVTSDDVREESQDEIAAQIISGMKPRGLGVKDKVFKQDDRDKAIEMGVKMAKTGDIVVAAGMGHEMTQLIGKTEIKRSDREAFLKALALEI